MKKIAFLPFLVLTMIIAGCTANVGNAEHEFWVRGNCDMCKATIETALSDVDGVASATYDLDNHAATVSYDSTKTSPEAFYTAVSEAGYDTRKEKAVVAAYQALPTCCKKPEDM